MAWNRATKTLHCDTEPCAATVTGPTYERARKQARTVHGWGIGKQGARCADHRTKDGR